MNMCEVTRRKRSVLCLADVLLLLGIQVIRLLAWRLKLLNDAFDLVICAAAYFLSSAGQVDRVIESRKVNESRSCSRKHQDTFTRLECVCSTRQHLWPTWAGLIAKIAESCTYYYSLEIYFIHVRKDHHPQRWQQCEVQVPWKRGESMRIIVNLYYVFQLGSPTGAHLCVLKTPPSAFVVAWLIRKYFLMDEEIGQWGVPCQTGSTALWMVEAASLAWKDNPEDDRKNTTVFFQIP